MDGKVEREGARWSRADRDFKERLEAVKGVLRRTAKVLEVNEILQGFRGELRRWIPQAMEACVLLLDTDAPKYTRPLQCALYERPMNCLACKRNRPAVQKAVTRHKAVLVHRSDPVRRHDGSTVEIGPEMAVPVMMDGEVVAVLSVVAKPGSRFTRRDLYILKDFSELIGYAILREKRHWETTQEKIRISQILGHLSPFVPLAVRKIVEKNPDLDMLKKERREATVIFLDLENYTQLSSDRPQTEVNDLIETLFSSFVDPIHRSHGDIVETAGDGLMIVFKDHDNRTNAIHAVQAAFDIRQITERLNQQVTGITRPLKVNMGINSGVALVGATQFRGASGIRMTYTASGPVTNLAARLAAHAKGGDILIGEETRRLIGDLWPVYDRGVVHLKGIEEPVAVYSLLRPEEE